MTKEYPVQQQNCEQTSGRQLEFDSFKSRSENGILARTLASSLLNTGLSSNNAGTAPSCCSKHSAYTNSTPCNLMKQYWKETEAQTLQSCNDFPPNNTSKLSSVKPGFHPLLGGGGGGWEIYYITGSD